jgi:hypothetical protein
MSFEERAEALKRTQELQAMIDAQVKTDGPGSEHR